MDEPRRLLGVREVCRTLGISQFKFRKVRRDPRFPRPIRLGTCPTPHWRVAAIDEYLEWLQFREDAAAKEAKEQMTAEQS